MLDKLPVELLQEISQSLSLSTQYQLTLTSHSTMLDKLPVELLQEISQSLSLSTQYQLTLTSHSVRNVIQPYLTKSIFKRQVRPRSNLFELPSLICLDNPAFNDIDPREAHWFKNKRAIVF
ncbi:hypothetical protein WICPIJ_004331 [Wickerhamomyces pijperi]|uniref:F-box domain-containing protein n=1 Tax=Wickerhamomyces pijperi TaxID=599730 RepID=A0A9P8TND8_WICPI|nr:hypothetical protein WICPIJ_004331 [Wickerhamomyces pijperi]